MFEQEKKSRFELVILLKDTQGNPTGKKKSFYADNGETLERHWINNNGIPKKNKGKKKKVGAAKTDKEISVALEEMSSHVNKIRQERNLED